MDVMMAMNDGAERRDIQPSAHAGYQARAMSALAGRCETGERLEGCARRARWHRSCGSIARIDMNDVGKARLEEWKLTGSGLQDSLGAQRANKVSFLTNGRMRV